MTMTSKLVEQPKVKIQQLSRSPSSSSLTDSELEYLDTVDGEAQLIESLYSKIAEIKSVVVPRQDYLKIAKQLPHMHFRIIETPVR